MRDLAARTGKAQITVGNHLRVLTAAGLAFEVSGLWYRTHFDPEAVVCIGHHQVPIHRRQGKPQTV